jgi:hypothetical protein
VQKAKERDPALQGYLRIAIGIHLLFSLMLFGARESFEKTSRESASVWPIIRPIFFKIDVFGRESCQRRFLVCSLYSSKSHKESQGQEE